MFSLKVPWFSSFSLNLSTSFYEICLLFLCKDMLEIEIICARFAKQAVAEKPHF